MIIAWTLFAVIIVVALLVNKAQWGKIGGWRD